MGFYLVTVKGINKCVGYLYAKADYRLNLPSDLSRPLSRENKLDSLLTNAPHDTQMWLLFMTKD